MSAIANSHNRKLTRHAIGTGLRAVLVGNGLPCNVVYDEATDAWQQNAPATLVVTSGAHRGERFMGTGQLKSEFEFALITIVPDSDLTATPPFTAAMSEDTLDDIEKLVSDWIANNESMAGQWTKLWRLPGISRIEKVVDAKPYKQETILVQCAPVYDA
jgi:hypothetical protein